MNIPLKLGREMGHGGWIPRGWKMAWYDPCHRAGVYYPVPLHWVVRALREFNYRLRIALRAPVMECRQVFEMQRKQREQQRAAEQYTRGYLAGWHKCFAMCLEEMEEELKRTDVVWDIGSVLAELEKHSRMSN
ncbi:MAG: hypothetical protein WA405_12880 [Candidatus Acidiferrales bacterium]